MKNRLTVWLLFAGFMAQGQSYENIVFEGAGIRGIAYSGVVSELDKRGLRKDFINVAGTSAGAITALLFSLGYTGQEMEQIIASTKFQEFNDGQWMLFGGLHRLKKKFGYYRGEAFSRFIGELIEQKTGNPNSTFSELEEAGFPNLFITGTCLTKQELTIFSAESFPDMRVKDAVRISMSIPLYFEAVLLDENGQIVSQLDSSKCHDVYVDGGLTGNFPIWIFDVPSDDGKPTCNPKTLGIRIDSSDQIQQDQLQPELIHQSISSFDTYISALYIFINENLNRNSLDKSHWDNTISVSSKGIGPKIKKLSFEEKSLLVASGKAAVSHFYEQIPQ